jgi:enoyl-CoA hydratase
VFAPGGDLGGGNGVDDWMSFGTALSMDVTPFETLRQSVKPVVSAVNGLCQGGGPQIAMCSDMAVVGDRATFRVPELYRGIADTYYAQTLARIIGRSGPGISCSRSHAERSGGGGLGHGGAGGAARRTRRGRARRVGPLLSHRTAGPLGGQVQRDNYLGLFDRIGMKASYSGAEAVEGFVAFKERRSPEWVHPALRIDGRL